jgi:hypothetical protein
MKKLLIAVLSLFIITSLPSCNATKKATDFVHKHCPDSSIKANDDGTFTVSISCENLYNTEQLQKYIVSGKITYDVANAELHVTGVSKQSVPDIMAILKAIVSGVKK